MKRIKAIRTASSSSSSSSKAKCTKVDQGSGSAIGKKLSVREEMIKAKRLQQQKEKKAAILALKKKKMMMMAAKNGGDGGEEGGLLEVAVAVADAPKAMRDADIIG